MADQSSEMDRAALLQKLKEKKKLIALGVVTVVLAGSAAVVVPKFLGKKHGDSHAKHAEHEEDDSPEADHGDEEPGHKKKKYSKAKKSKASKSEHTEDQADEADSHSAHANVDKDAKKKSDKHAKKSKKDTHAAHAVPHSPTWGDRFKEAWEETRVKIRAIRNAMDDNERLRIENAALQIKAESLKFDCSYKEATHKTFDAESRLVKETGSKVGRSLSSITYTPPTHLLPPQLYVLGVSYFKAKEDEKAAVILTFLTGLEESDAYKTAKNYLMTGVSWYRLDNFEVADQYFAKAIETKDLPENHPYQAQSRLWRGLVAQSLAQRSKAQFWLRDLIDHHPHSVEAGWVNPHAKEARRVPASAPKKH